MKKYLDDIRRNHALEHATVQLLIAKLGPTFHVAGRAAHDGFFILGAIPKDALEECAVDALARLQRGESYWAITPLCGTNIAVGAFFSSLATLAMISGRSSKQAAGNAITASMLALVAAQPAGRWLQRNLTTKSDLAGTEILSVESHWSDHFFKVRTRNV